MLEFGLWLFSLLVIIIALSIILGVNNDAINGDDDW